MHYIFIIYLSNRCATSSARKGAQSTSCSLMDSPLYNIPRVSGPTMSGYTMPKPVSKKSKAVESNSQAIVFLVVL